MSEEMFFYGQEDMEQVTQQSLDEAVQEYVDGCDYDQPLPKTLTIGKFTVMEIPRDRFEVLERLLEGLDEDYSDPDYHTPTKPTQAMKDAEKTFITVMQKEYKNYWLERVEKIEVDLEKWCAENGYEKEWNKGLEVK
jgi:hypothetical protein